MRRKGTEKRTHQRRNLGKVPTYEQIFMWHNQQGYSGIFGKFPAGSKFVSRFQVELKSQAENIDFVLHVVTFRSHFPTIWRSRRISADSTPSAWP